MGQLRQRQITTGMRVKIQGLKSASGKALNGQEVGTLQINLLRRCWCCNADMSCSVSAVVPGGDRSQGCREEQVGREPQESGYQDHGDRPFEYIPGR